MLWVVLASGGLREQFHPLVDGPDVSESLKPDPRASLQAEAEVRLKTSQFNVRRLHGKPAPGAKVDSTCRGPPGKSKLQVGRRVTRQTKH